VIFVKKQTIPWHLVRVFSFSIINYPKRSSNGLSFSCLACQLIGQVSVKSSRVWRANAE